MSDKTQCVGLKASAEQRSKNAEDKVRQAIETLLCDNKPVSFGIVASISGVSRSTLYNNQTIREQIVKLRGSVKVQMQKTQTEEKRKPGLFQKQLSALRAENQKLKEDKKKLIIQLAQLEDLRDENTRLKRQLADRNTHRGAELK